MKIYFFLLFIPTLIQAKTFLPKELVELSLQHTPEIKTQIFALKSSQAQLNHSKVLGNPMFTFQGGGVKSGTFTGGVTDYTINQPLPWPGKRAARIKTHEFLIGLAEVDHSEMRLQVAHRVYNLVAELSALQEMEKHYAERKRRFSLIQTSLRARPLASPKQQVERDLIETQIALMERGMIDLLARKETVKWELTILTGVKVDEVKFSWEQLPPSLLKDDYISLLDKSPKSKRWKLESNVSANKIEEARLEARPDIIVGANYRRENVYPVNHFYHAQVSVVIPIMDVGRHSVEAARAEHRKTEAYQSVQKNEYLSNIHQTYSELDASRKAIQIFPLKELRRIEGKFDSAEGAFRKGQIDAITFLQIDSQIHENIDQIFLTRVNYVNALSKLNSLIGKGPEL